MVFAATVNVELLLCQVMPVHWLAYLGGLSQYTKHQQSDIVLHQCIRLFCVLLVLLHISCRD